MGVERLDRREGEERAEAESDIRCAPDFGAGGIDRHRQALAAKGFRTRHRVPPGGDPALIGVGPAGRGRHLVVGELDAVFVAHGVQRRQHVAGEFSGFLQHGGGDVAVEIAVMAGLHGRLQAGAVVEREQNVGDRRAIGHDENLAFGLMAAAVFPRNPGRLNSPMAGIGPPPGLGRPAPGDPGDNPLYRVLRCRARFGAKFELPAC